LFEKPFGSVIDEYGSLLLKLQKRSFVLVFLFLDGQGPQVPTPSLDAGEQERLYYSWCPHENNSINYRQ